MSIYFAHPADTSSLQSVALAIKDKGLSFYKAKPSDVTVTVLPTIVQPGYAAYVKNLPAFMEATLTSKRTLICNRGYPITEVPYLLPFRLPSVIYDFERSPNDRQREEINKHSTEVKGRAKESSFVMTAPTINCVKSLVTLGANQRTSHLVGTVNIDALKQVLILQRIFSAFLLTHAYPAFYHNEDVTPSAAIDNSIVVANKKRKIDGSTYVACITDVESNIDGAMDNDEQMQEANTQPSPNEIQLTYAKPTQNQKDRWGAIAGIPNSSGIYIPYVRELAIADLSTVPTLVSTTFVRSLASTTQGMFSSMDSLRQAWGLICTTELGHEITHLAKCFDIALQAQAFVYPIYTNNVYEGTVICGAGYTVNVRTTSVEPLPFADLQKLVQDKSAHGRAIENICGHLDDKDSALVRGCESIRALANCLQGIMMDELMKQDIVKEAHHLCFNNKYWSTAAINIRKSLELLMDTKTDIGEDVPMYPKFLFSVDRYELVFSAFGHMAYTLMIPNGARCNLANKEPPKNFHARPVAVEAAILDMKYIVENGFLTNNIQNLSSKHRDIPIKSSDKGWVWDALKKIHGVKGNSGKTVSFGGNLPTKNAGDDLW